MLAHQSSTFLSCSDVDEDMSILAPEPSVLDMSVEPNLKVVLLQLHPSSASNLFYIRTAYNVKKDILILYWQNYNGIISPYLTYLGSRTLSDGALMSERNLIVRQWDSTAPLSGMTTYWSLYGQHGYAVPTIGNNMGMKSADVGSLWCDQLSRQYRIGNVTSTLITLLPVLYVNTAGNVMRMWQSPYSEPITQLKCLEAGRTGTSFDVADYSYTQLYPIMRSQDRVFMGDGEVITEPGTYYFKHFCVGETQIGYDPVTIMSWFPPSLDTAVPMARFTWNYSFCGSQCSVHTTIELMREACFMNYCATQQQTFTDRGDYRAFFMIPKAMPQDGVILDRPFNSPSRSGKDIYFYRTEKYLRDVNDPIDRLVAFLHNDATDDYLLGMSAGLSLITGDTRPEKRCENILYGEKEGATRLALFSPLNNNKFYISAINASPFADYNYYWPVGYSREIDYYVCYFDPAANEGQVYWYKDDDRYIIYAHCQVKHDKLNISVPLFMDGCTLKVVEKTPSSELLTQTIQEGKFIVRYNDDSANYIVLTATP